MDTLGPDGVVPADDLLFGATEEAVRIGEQWIASRT